MSDMMSEIMAVKQETKIETHNLRLPVQHFINMNKTN